MKRTIVATSLALVISAARLFAAAPIYSNNFAASVSPVAATTGL